MYTIALIGAGQLGSRHLQGILQMKLPFNVEVVDLNEDALALTKSRASEMPHNENLKDIRYLSSLDELSKEIDVCIIATTANVRFRIIEKLVSVSKVKNLVLEKIVFQKTEEFALTEKLLNEHGIQCWVNCPRRLFSVYEDLEKQISQADKLTYMLSGGDWGMACNALHFIDLISFLNKNESFEFDTTGITSVIGSKRNGFYEFAGTLKVTLSNGTEIFLHSRQNCTAPIKAQLLAPGFSWQIDEANGELQTMAESNGWKSEKTGFNILYQSQLSNLICESILTTGNPGIPTFASSRKLHEKMLPAFEKKFNEFGIDCSKGCPIT